MSRSLEERPAASLPDAAVSVRSRVGVVVIGRNEGERLKRCIGALLGSAERIVYVDSGSTDGSQDWARSQSVVVLELDMSVPFTMARGRNAGWRWFAEQPDPVDFIQFVDGDCEVRAGWIEFARQALETAPELVAVCGRRRERAPDSSIYNRLMDMEWKQPIGEADAFTGDVMLRASALEAVDGFEEAMIAGEDTELAYRLRVLGGRIMQFDREMSLHDAAITSFRQWMVRASRAGFWLGDGFARHGRGPSRMNARAIRSAWGWGLVVPLLLVASVVAAIVAGGLWWSIPIGLVALWLVQAARVGRSRRRTFGESRWEGALYGISCLVSKPAQLAGLLRFRRIHAQGQRPRLIEYK